MKEGGRKGEGKQLRVVQVNLKHTVWILIQWIFSMFP